MWLFKLRPCALFLKAVRYTQSTTGQLRTRKSGGPGGGKVSGDGETITFADVAGVDEAKEELEEIVVGSFILIYALHFAEMIVKCFCNCFVFMLLLISLTLGLTVAGISQES